MLSITPALLSAEPRLESNVYRHFPPHDYLGTKTNIVTACIEEPMMSQLSLVDLSTEILHNIFSFLNACDLAGLGGTCRLFHDFLNRDDLLWQRIYLSRFDEPRSVDIVDSWARRLRNLVKLEKLLQSQDYEVKRKEWAFIGKQILPMLLSTTNVKPDLNTKFLSSNFHHLGRVSNASTLLRQSSLFRRCGTPDDLPADTVALRQLSARLHIYSALPMEVRQSEYLEVDNTEYLHPFARSRLYDLRRYKESNFWGPFMDDGSGRIDWEKVQAIYVVLGYGLRMLSERVPGSMNTSLTWGMGFNGDAGDEMWKGLGPGSYRGMIESRAEKEEDAQSSAATAGSTQGDVDEDEMSSVPPLNWFYDNHEDRREAEFQHQQAIFASQDPYGVKGTWMRIVNFLDYHDLFAFNFSGPRLRDDQERDPITTTEAFRLILLKLWVTKIEWPDEDEGQPEDWETVAGSTASSPVATRSESPPADSPEDATPPDSERSILESLPAKAQAPTTAQPKIKSKYPIVHFAGRSRSLHIRWDPNANSHIRGSNPFYHVIGYVRAYPAPSIPKYETELDPPPQYNNLSHIYLDQYTPPSPPDPVAAYKAAEKLPSETVTGIPAEEDLVIRWTTFSVFHGEERWRSEGVQIGGLKSARGILGNWFDKDYDQHGPAGPTGFWKLGDSVEMYGKRGAAAGATRIWGDDDD